MTNTKTADCFKPTFLPIAMLLFGAIALSSCGGREAHPIAPTAVTDNTLDCGSIAREFKANERQNLSTIKERSQAAGKNVILGATGVLLFWPALFFMDPKSPEKVEIDALRNRNSVLTELARSKGCPLPKSELTEAYKRLDSKTNSSPPKGRD
jgi:hypothetical protein